MANKKVYEEANRYMIYLDKRVHDRAVKKAGVGSFSGLVNTLLIKFIGKGDN